MIKRVLLGCTAVLGITVFFLWDNGTFRTAARALAGSEYPTLWDSADQPFITFDLTDLEPAILALGLALPKDNSDNVQEMIGSLKVASAGPASLQRTYWNFRKTGKKVLVFHVFEFSNSKEKNIVVSLTKPIAGAEIVLFDYGIK